MNIFERKLQQTIIQNKPIDPVIIFDDLFQEEGYEYLRGVQEEFLKTWHEKYRDERDVIGKMNTGSGKTLVGLLMLLSKLHENIGPVVYLCPDHQLVSQTIRQAELYGVPVCTFDNDNDFPFDFLNQKSILVCTFEKLFNGLSIFERDYIQLGALVLDDAHECVQLARKQSTIVVESTHNLYTRLFNLFKEDLKAQAPGTFRSLENQDPGIFMRVPYWSWLDKSDQVLNILSDKEFNNDSKILFPWQLMRDDLTQYDCYFSGNTLEISPIHVPYHMISTFSEAKHRYILSATFEDDTHFIKDLGISEKSILNPIIPKDRKDIGERLILAPSRYNSSLKDDQIRHFIAGFPKENLNVVVIVPSDYQSRVWVELGAVKVNKDNIRNAIDSLESSQGNFMVFVNRYDGLDLLGDMCRILVLDGKPKLHSLRDKNLGAVREGSSIIDAKLGQTIEQGLGRGVRAGSDYCAVFILNPELVRFLGTEKNMNYFTPVTRVQIELGIKLLDEEEEVSQKPFEKIKEVVDLCLNKDKSWRQYHQIAVKDVRAEQITPFQKDKVFISVMERESIKEFRKRNYEKAADIILTYIEGEERAPWLNEKDIGWYYQLAAQFIYLANKHRSNDLQIKAYQNCTRSLPPPYGTSIIRLERPNKVQAALVRQKIAGFLRPQDISIYMEDLLSLLVYSPEITADQFHDRLEELGLFLGFTSQQPERDFGNGPDNLWCMSDNHYLILESKSRRTNSKITRDNIEQLYHSEKWFKQQYGESCEYTLVTLQPPRQKEEDVIIGQNVRVMDQERLDLLRLNLRQFVKALENKAPNTHTEQEIGYLLHYHHLDSVNFRMRYLVSIR